MSWSVEFFVDEDGQSLVLEWFEAQSPKVQARFAWIFDLMQERGLVLGEPYIKHLEGKIFEIRAEQNTNIYRIAYVAFTGQRFVLLHGFQKKTQKTPRREIETAQKRYRQLVEKENRL